MKNIPYTHLNPSIYYIYIHINAYLLANWVERVCKHNMAESMTPIPIYTPKPIHILYIYLRLNAYLLANWVERVCKLNIAESMNNIPIYPFKSIHILYIYLRLNAYLLANWVERVCKHNIAESIKPIPIYPFKSIHILYISTYKCKPAGELSRVAVASAPWTRIGRSFGSSRSRHSPVSKGFALTWYSALT